MVKSLKCRFLEALHAAASEKKISQNLSENLLSFYEVCCKELQGDVAQAKVYDTIFFTFLQRIQEQIQTPFAFEPYHKRERSPFDFYAFGLNFLRPLVDKENSILLGTEHLKRLLSYLQRGHNAIFFANHQIEADPQAISLLLERIAPELAEEMIFVAGERVLTDPLAVPFSRGRNLLCIYSKRYIDNPIEEKHKKQLHNARTMERMSALLKEGGKCIYVAPSGGRDRPNVYGKIEVAPFDEKSIEMFYLMARRAKTPTHFFPLALSTYSLLPPPKTIQVELGERRTAKRGAIHLAIGKEIDMEGVPCPPSATKEERRKARATHIFCLVKSDYERLPS